MYKSMLQSTLQSLEDYKRTLGRRFDNDHSLSTMIKYNNVENNIAFLVEQCGCVRINSQPHKLKLTEVID